MPSVFITGANRGIGLGLAKLYLEDNWTVFASCRDPENASALLELENGNGKSFNIIKMDVNIQDQIDATVRELSGQVIDVLVNNAGIVEREGYGSGAYEGVDDPDLRHYDYEQWRDILTTNVLGPARVTGSFVDNIKLADAGIVVMMVSGLASVTNTWQAGRYAYRTSKAALNMLMRSTGEWLESLGITAVSISPGWTRTEMGGPNAMNSVDEAAAGVKHVIAGVNKEDAGKFLNFDGTTLPW